MCSGLAALPATPNALDVYQVYDKALHVERTASPVVVLPALLAFLMHF